MLTPIKKNVVVRLDGRLKLTKSGIVIPEVSRAAEQWGEVVAVGKDCTDLSVGDRVYISKLHGTHYIQNGEDAVIIEEQKVLAIQTA